ncbi:MFS transporter [Nonomuraea sp. NPDC046802]|uniref:MFS transporter n=1 Tax=Nonomuraea sp. NPDC046802 TaxID=3154919 RepID=UPI0033F75CE5
MPGILEHAMRHAGTQAALGMTEVFIASALAPERLAAPAVGAAYDQDRLDTVIDNLARTCAAITAEGLRPCLHPHVGTWIETERETRAVLDAIDPRQLSFGPDTGHLHWAGADPAELITHYGDRAGAAHGTSVEELLADPAVEIVAVCSPHAFHAEQAEAACLAGKKAVLVEKPPATTLDDARRIAKASKDTGGPIVVGAVHTYDPAFKLTFGFYVITDRLGYSPVEAVSLVFTGGSLITATIGGWLSDRLEGRKIFVPVASLVMGVGLLTLGFTTTFPRYLLGSLILGMGTGVYMAVDMALVVRVLPNPDNAAKDLAVFQIANSLPQSLAPLIAPLFLTIGGGNQNYPAAFTAALVFAVLGALTVIPIRKVR